jgi:hypothetical protein
MKIFLTWLPVFCGIWIGGIVLSVIVEEMEPAIFSITGKLLNLDIVRNFLLLASFYAALGGMTSLALVKVGKINKENILQVALIAGLIGIFHSVFVTETATLDMWAKKIKISNSGSLLGMGIGIFFGIIVGIFASKIATIVMGALIPASVLIFLIVLQRSGKLDRINSISAFLMVFYLFVGGAWLGIWVINNIKGGIPCFIFGCLDGLILGGVLGYATGVSVDTSNTSTSTFFISLFQPLIILATQRRKVICASCLRYSFPLKSYYDSGERYCEHCSQLIEKTKSCGKAIFTFGDYQADQGDRRFIFANPDLEKKDTPIDISEVCIDIKTVDKRLLEKFITYIRNYPPKYGLKSVRIFYKGRLDELGHLKNLILNNFKKVTAVGS